MTTHARFDGYRYALLIIFLGAAVCRADCGAENPEAFDEFLSRFSVEKPFAIERTRLPLRVVRWGDTVDTDGRRMSDPQNYDLSLSEYWHWPTLNEYIQNHHLQSQLTSRSGAVQHLDLFQDGYSIKVLYRFEASNGCWFLTRYESKPI